MDILSHRSNEASNNLGAVLTKSKLPELDKRTKHRLQNIIHKGTGSLKGHINKSV